MSPRNTHAESPVPQGAGLFVRLSPSQLTTFMACEEQWVRDQARPRGEDGHRIQKESAGLGATRGTLIHKLLAVADQGGDWIAASVELATEMFPGWDPDWQLPSLVEDAIRLVSRYQATYPVKHQVIGEEWQFALRHPADRQLEITGYQDGLILVSAQDDPEHAGLWVVERKSMSRWDRLDWLADDPQPATYLWAARAQGFKVRGLMYDAIYTARWKEEREPEASFRRLWLEYDQPQVDRTLDAYARVAARIREIRAGSTPVLSIGKTCSSSYCAFVQECRDGLAC